MNETNQLISSDKSFLSSMINWIEDENVEQIDLTLKFIDSSSHLKQLVSLCSFSVRDEDIFSSGVFISFWKKVSPVTAPSHHLEVLAAMHPNHYAQALPLMQQGVGAFPLAHTLTEQLKPYDLYNERIDLHRVVQMLDILAPFMSSQERQTILNRIEQPRARVLENLVELDQATQNALNQKSPTPPRKV